MILTDTFATAKEEGPGEVAPALHPTLPDPTSPFPVRPCRAEGKNECATKGDAKPDANRDANPDVVEGGAECGAETDA